MFKLCTNKNHSYKHNEQINNQNIDNSECVGVKKILKNNLSTRPVRFGCILLHNTFPSATVFSFYKNHSSVKIESWNCYRIIVSEKLRLYSRILVKMATEDKILHIRPPYV
jgi:hypothetical protein